MLGITLLPRLKMKTAKTMLQVAGGNVHFHHLTRNKLGYYEYFFTLDFMNFTIGTYDV